MRRWTGWVALLWLMAGCASGGTQVVQGGDEQWLQEMTRFNVVEEEIAFDAADTRVHATLTRPEGEQDVPAVVLVAGSGPTDRDWNNPLLPGDNGTAIELADRLARAGIAVLRYDKRGTGHTELAGPISWDDYLAEVEQAVHRLREDEATDRERVFIAGHSEGGAHALRAVVDNGVEVGGLILLATPGRPMRDLVMAQVTDQLRDAGLTDEAIDAELNALQRAMEAVARREEINPERVSDIPGLVALVQTLQTEDAREFAASLLPWDPSRAIAEVTDPVLILSGLKDTQIDARHDSTHLYDAARRYNEEVRLKLVEDADHVLKYQPRPLDEMGAQHSLVYNDPTRYLDEGVLTALVRWIDEH